MRTHSRHLKQSLQFQILFVLMFVFSLRSAWADPTKVACVGDSITRGLRLANPVQDCYPSRLGALLGENFEVRNFGVSSATALENGDLPYVQQKAYQEALAYKPDVVVIALGTNDTKTANFPSHPDDFEPSYRALIAKFREANPNARIYSCLPVPAFTSNYGITESVLAGSVIPAIQNAASQMGVPLIDLHSALAGKRYCFPDRVHPNEEGALLIARAVYQGLTGAEAPAVRKSTKGLTILPMGDSITVGATDPLTSGGGSGYRDELYARLKNSGADFQFVGSSITGASSTLRAAAQDFHEGHSGYKLSDLRNNLEANLSDPSFTSNGGYWFSGGNNTDRDALSPNVVLLLAGINDIVAQTPLTTVQERMTSLLDWFAANRPATRVLVGTLLPFDDATRKTSGINDKVRAFNDWLRQTIPARSSGRVFLVDQYSLFVDANGLLKTKDSPDGIYLSDGIHPSHNGYVAMGDAWFDTVLSNREAPSLVVTSTDDVENAFDDQITLREAINYANSLSSTATEAPTITFDPQVFSSKRTITLKGTPLPQIWGSLTIRGSKAGVTIDGDRKSDLLASCAPNVMLKALTFANGLGWCVRTTEGRLTVQECTFVGNTQAVGANATTDAGATFVLRNCTLSGNDIAVFAHGGSSTLNISNCTIVNNGVGLHNEGGRSSFNVSNTILTNNTQIDSDTSLASSQFNIIGHDASLDPNGLQNNGGPTDTIALLPTSPAINAGDPSFGSPSLATASSSSSDSAAPSDQRSVGFARVCSGRLDIGAFEVQNLAPTAADDAFSTLEDTPLRLDATKGVLANDADPDGKETLQIQLITAPRNGKLTLGTTGAFTYTPALNWNGIDAFTYSVSDGQFTSQATATITVAAVNDAPTAKVSLSPSSPTTNTVLRATAVGSDAEGDNITFTYTWKKGADVLAGENGPTLDLSQAGYGDKGQRISVTVTPNDGQVNGPPAVATVLIANTAPTLTSAAFQGTENQVLSASLTGQDADGDALRYGVARAPRFGALALQSNGAFTYTPRNNWNGSDSFVARVLDSSGAYASATFSITIAPINGAPVAVNDFLRGVEDVPLSISAATLLRNDSNGEIAGETDPLRIIAVATPLDFPGTVTLEQSAQKIVFAPAPNWNGTTRFSYTVQDSGQATSTAQVTLQFLPVNDAPFAQSGNLTVVSGTVGELPLQGSDVEGSPLTFALSGKPVNGTAQVVKVGAQWLLRYQSKVGFVGNDTLSVVARDGQLNSAPASITVAVQPNNAPQLLGLTPNSGVFSAGSTAIFEQKVCDADGTAHLDATALLIGNSPSYANARGGATLWFDAVANQFTLTKDDGTSTFAPVALGGTLENTQVSATLGPDDVSRDIDGTLTLRWHITFKLGFTGTKSLWGRVEDLGGLSAGFSKQGDITLASPSQAPSSTTSAPTS